MEIIIHGKPIAKKRPRFARRGKFVSTYSEQETEEEKFFLLAKEQVKECLSGPLLIRCFFYFCRPKSHFGTGKNEGYLKSSAPMVPTGKPDIDNCVKFVLDCLNGLAWQDDKQITILFAKKAYGEAMTKIEILGMKEPEKEKKNDQQV